MVENLIVSGKDKEVKYIEILPQIKSLISGESDLIANLANISAALKMTFGWLWVGFYLVKEDQLVLGPFQGPLACTRIPYAKGVCGNAWSTGLTQVVPDVDQFPGHIACSSLSRSEIVVPLFNQNHEIIGVLDVDSAELDTFDEVDRHYLQQLVEYIF